jgi:hypothetical protein
MAGAMGTGAMLAVVAPSARGFFRTVVISEDLFGQVLRPYFFQITR